MVSQAIYSALENLAEEYIPEGEHSLLHVNSREFWIDIMVDLLERGLIAKKLSAFTKCAVSWELLLVQKISSQN